VDKQMYIIFINHLTYIITSEQTCAHLAYDITYKCINQYRK